MPMVEYWRRMNAQAPSAILEFTSCIAGVPASARKMYLISARANTMPTAQPITTTQNMPGMYVMFTS
jgi:hypothetical protein